MSVITPSELLRGFQPSLPMHIPRYRIPMEYVISVPDMICCEQTTTGTNWASHGTVDHPSFARLRNHLESHWYISTSRNSSNGDIVLSEFYLNDVRFVEGDRFYCASAMKFHLENSPKFPMKKEEPKKMNYDAELRNWQIVRSYYGTLVARGKIYNDAKGRFNDGDLITTSVIQDIDGEKCLLVTKNTIYLLGGEN